MAEIALLANVKKRLPKEEMTAYVETQVRATIRGSVAQRNSDFQKKAGRFSVS